jgi:hypothetical protein
MGATGWGTLVMLAKVDRARPVSFIPSIASAVADRTEHRRWTFDFRSIGMVFATNTTLFCALDMAQWLSDRYALSTLPTNLVAAVIATTLGLVFAAQGSSRRSPSHAGAARRHEPFAGWHSMGRRRWMRALAHTARSGNARTAALRLSSGPRLRPSSVSARHRPPTPNT